MATVQELIRTMLGLERFEATAVCSGTSRGVRTVFHFHAGQLVWVAGGAVETTLGRLLRKEGLLTDEQYSTVIERMSEALEKGEELRFGDAAVQFGFLKPVQIAHALREQAHRKVVDCLGCRKFDIDVSDSPAAAKAVAVGPRVDLSLQAAVTDGVRLNWDEDRCAEFVADMVDARPTLRVDAAALAARLGLGMADMALVASIDGTRTTREIVTSSSLGTEQALRLFAALVVLEAAAVPAKPVAAKAAARSRASAPPKAPTSAVAKTAAPPAPPSRDDRLVRLEAEQIFQSGQALLEAGETEEAAQVLRKASALYPEAAEYALAAAWAAFRCPGDAKKTEARRQALKKAAVRALDANANLALGHYALGLVLAAEGDPVRAARFLARAVALDPTNGDAKTKLARLLEPKRRK